MTICEVAVAVCRIMLAVFCVYPVAQTFAQPAPADEALRAARALYDPDNWPKGPVREGFPLGSLEIKGWKGEQLRSNAGHLQRRFTATEKAGKPAAILIEAFVGDTAEKSHEKLLDWLAGEQSPDAAPRIQDINLKAGDVGYYGPSGPRRQNIAWVAFANGNIAVRVGNAEARSHPDLDVRPIVSTLDAIIVSQPAVPEGQKPKRPVIDRLTSAKQEVTAGETVRLDLAITDPKQGVPHVQWVIGGPGQGYAEADPENVWSLHTTKSGIISLSAEVTASTGTFAAKQIKITVLPARKR